jgi:hypothetical protein
MFEAFEEVDENGVPVPVWVKKATGLGATTLGIRYLAWKAVVNDDLRGSLMAIVTGPNIELATDIITRVKDIFIDFVPEHASFDTKMTFCYLNGVKIQAFPSHNLSALRGRPNVSYILGDEGDFFPKNQQWGLRDVTERYIGKSGSKILLISTPNAPGGLFEKIEFEEPSIYKKLFLPYTVGLGKIYDDAEIEKAKESPSFEREYNLKYLGLEGNVVTTEQIDRSCLGAPSIWTNLIDKNPAEYFGKNYPTSIGVDPGFGSSPFGITVTKYIQNKIVVVHAQEYDKPSHEVMLHEIVFLMNKFKTTRPKVYIDGANAAWIRSLKIQLREYADYHYYTAEKLKRLIFSPSGMIAAPIPFNQYGQKMLEHMRLLFEKNKIVIDRQKFPHLVTALRTAKISEETGKLDKDRTSYNNVFDAFRLNLLNYRLTRSNIF